MRHGGRIATATACTSGPLTAMESIRDGDGNGVFCYASSTCSPSETYRDSNYWVSPLWRYRYSGFYAPVDNGTWNSAKAGSANGASKRCESTTWKMSPAAMYCFAASTMRW